MIADLVIIARRPTIHVDVFRFDWPYSHGRRDKDVIKLLVEVLIYVCIPLNGRNKCQVVNLGDDAIEGLKHRSGLDELVPVSSKDDAGKGIYLQQRLDEGLATKSVGELMHPMHCQTYSNGFDLGCTLIDVAVQRRTRVALVGGASVRFRCVVNVNGEERLAICCLPLSNKWLTAYIPGGVRGIDAAGVEAV